MAVKTINPYLFFDGTAADAIAFYEKALEAKVVQVHALLGHAGRRRRRRNTPTT